jgi:hypothetical protein
MQRVKTNIVGSISTSNCGVQLQQTTSEDSNVSHNPGPKTYEYSKNLDMDSALEKYGLLINLHWPPGLNCSGPVPPRPWGDPVTLSCTVCLTFNGTAVKTEMPV